MNGILYNELFPDRKLADFVKCFWCAKNVTGAAHEFTILPDGHFGMIVQFEKNNFQSIYLKGIWTKPFNIIIPADTAFYAIRFKPIAAESILLFNISEILDQNRALEKSFWGIDELPFKSLSEFSDLLTTKMLAVLEASKKIDERKLKLFGLLFETKGSASVEQISKTLFWSSRQINRY